jgi:hypothetical protein
MGGSGKGSPVTGDDDPASAEMLMPCCRADVPTRYVPKLSATSNTVISRP